MNLSYCYPWSSDWSKGLHPKEKMIWMYLPGKYIKSLPLWPPNILFLKKIKNAIFLEYISWVHSNYFLFWAQSFGSIRAPRIIIRTVHTKWIKTNLVISISLGSNSLCYVTKSRIVEPFQIGELKSNIFDHLKHMNCVYSSNW